MTLTNKMNCLTNRKWQSDPLGEYRWADCAGPMAKIADAIWIYGGSDSRLSGQLLVPHWKTCLAVIRSWTAGTYTPNDVQLSMLGPIATPRWNGEIDNVEIVAVRLQPEAVAALFDILPSDIIDRDLPVAADPRLDEVRRIAEQGEPAERIAAALVDFLADAANQSRTVDPLTSAAAQLLRQASGQPRISAIANHLDISEQTFRRRFEQHVGVAPKYYARQFRLKHVLLEMDRYPRPNWSALALDFGYFDQAHMIEDIRALTGVGPSQLHAMRRQPAC